MWPWFVVGALVLLVAWLLWRDRDSARSQAYAARDAMRNERDKALFALALEVDKAKTGAVDASEQIKLAGEWEDRYRALLALYVAVAPDSDLDALRNGVFDPHDPGTGAPAGPPAGRPAEILRGPFPPRRPPGGDDSGGPGTV